MKRDYNVSVAMATYNGEHYIKTQIETILNNLQEQDELVISDDGSTDDTLKIISLFKDKRIKVLEGPRNGVKQNFANAIKNSKGKYIFLADQDDIWVNNKVDKVLEVFEKNNCTLVEHDCSLISKDETILNSFFEYRKCGPGIFKNIYKNTYIGCCMAFSHDLVEKILPIPNDIEMHDQWIGLKSDIHGKSVFIDDKLIKYRRHENNVSDCFKHYPVAKMIKNRIILIFHLLWR